MNANYSGKPAGPIILLGHVWYHLREHALPIINMTERDRKMADRVTLAHGDGGKLMHELIGRFRPKLSNKYLDELADCAEFKIKKERLADRKSVA